MRWRRSGSLYLCGLAWPSFFSYESTTKARAPGSTLSSSLDSQVRSNHRSFYVTGYNANIEMFKQITGSHVTGYDTTIYLPTRYDIVNISIYLNIGMLNIEMFKMSHHLVHIVCIVPTLANSFYEMKKIRKIYTCVACCGRHFFHMMPTIPPRSGGRLWVRSLPGREARRTFPRAGLDLDWGYPGLGRLIISRLGLGLGRIIIVLILLLIGRANGKYNRDIC